MLRGEQHTHYSVLHSLGCFLPYAQYECGVLFFRSKVFQNLSMNKLIDSTLSLFITNRYRGCSKTYNTMGNIFRFICLVPILIIKIALALCASIILLPYCILSMVGGTDTFDVYDEIWGWVFKF